MSFVVCPKIELPVFSLQSQAMNLLTHYEMSSPRAADICKHELCVFLKEWGLAVVLSHGYTGAKPKFAAA